MPVSGSQKFDRTSLSDNVLEMSDVPPSMPFQNHTPRKPKAPPPSPEGPAVDVVQCPDAKAAKEDGQSKSHKDPHLHENLCIADILSALYFFASLIFGR